MMVFYGIKNFPIIGKDLCITIGNFDGFHKGHKSIIESLFKSKKRIKGLMTFYPHTAEIVSIERKKNFLPLLPLEEKINIAKNYGFNYIFLIDFSKKVVNMYPEDFVNECIVKRVNAGLVIVGESFRFGKNGQGDINTLIKFGNIGGFNVMPCPILKYKEEKVSSTKIRNYVLRGELENVRDLLGYNFYIKGLVVKGSAIGRSIGFPTSNLYTLWRLLPPDGVYAGRAEVDGKVFTCAINLGGKPTINKKSRGIEVYIIDFNSNIYGKEIKIEFLKKIRDIIKFPSIELLKKQIRDDVKFIKKLLIYEFREVG